MLNVPCVLEKVCILPLTGGAYKSVNVNYINLVDSVVQIFSVFTNTFFSTCSTKYCGVLEFSTIILDLSISL